MSTTLSTSSSLAQLSTSVPDDLVEPEIGYDDAVASKRYYSHRLFANYAHVVSVGPCFDNKAPGKFVISVGIDREVIEERPLPTCLPLVRKGTVAPAKPSECIRISVRKEGKIFACVPAPGGSSIGRFSYKML